MTNRLYISTIEIEKARDLLEQAVFLMERTEGFYKKRLYQLDDVYFEVTWHLHFNVVIKVNSFTDTEPLDAYLNAISIEEVLA